MSLIKFEKEMKSLIENRKKIPDEFWVKAENNKDVIWFLNREDGTAGSYETSQERFGLTKEGDIIYGFSSGCSCWDGWSADDYAASVTYKEFTQKKIGGFKDENGYKSKEEGYDLSFSEGWDDECFKNLQDYLLLFKEDVTGQDVLQIKNAEVKRYLIKRIGYEQIKDKVDAKVLHRDGTSELLKIAMPNGEKEMYVKVKDSSTEREYLLYVPNNIKRCKEGIAWTFGLTEAEYQPVIET